MLGNEFYLLEPIFGPKIKDLSKERGYTGLLLVTETSKLSNLSMAGIILLFSGSDDISSSLFMNKIFTCGCLFVEVGVCGGCCSRVLVVVVESYFTAAGISEACEQK